MKPDETLSQEGARMTGRERGREREGERERENEIERGLNCVLIIKLRRMKIVRALFLV